MRLQEIYFFKVPQNSQEILQQRSPRVLVSRGCEQHLRVPPTPSPLPPLGSTNLFKSVVVIIN